MSQEASYTGPTSTKAAFTHRDTHPLVLDLLLLRGLGTECIAWEPTTVWSEIKRVWGTSVSEVNRNKIMATRVCQSVDTPYTEWPVFENVVGGLFGDTPDLDLMQRPTPHRCAAAIDIMTQIRDVPLSTEVKRYAAACLLDHGVAYGPGTLSFCNEYTAPIVSVSLQNRVAAALRAGVTPTFDGANDDDAQIMKSLMIDDFQRRTNELLLMQLNRLFGRNGEEK